MSKDSFSVILSQEAEAQLKKLDNTNVKRIIERLTAASQNPGHFFERLVGREEFKLRVGDYRLITQISQNDKKIFVISLGHRKNTYK